MYTDELALALPEDLLPFTKYRSFIYRLLRAPAYGPQPIIGLCTRTKIHGPLTCVTCAAAGF